jgi:hypothetical protein
MSKLAQARDESFDDQYDTDIGDDDYGFIVGPDGELKSVFLPDSIPFKQTKKLQKILKVFGILDADQLDNPTLH